MYGEARDRAPRRRGDVEFDVEISGNRAVVVPRAAGGQMPLLIDAVFGVMEEFGAEGAQSVTVRQEDGPNMVIQSEASQDLYNEDRTFKVTPIGAFFEVSAASQGGGYAHSVR